MNVSVCTCVCGGGSVYYQDEDTGQSLSALHLGPASRQSIEPIREGRTVVATVTAIWVSKAEARTTTEEN